MSFRRALISSLDRLTEGVLTLNGTLMSDPNLDPIVAALPDLATAIEGLASDLAGMNVADPRATQIVEQIQQMTTQVKAAAGSVGTSATSTTTAGTTGTTGATGATNSTGGSSIAGVTGS